MDPINSEVSCPVTITGQLLHHTGFDFNRTRGTMPTMGDSQSVNAVANAVAWLQASLLGTIATAIAVVAVGCVGLLMLSGRLDVRRGAQVGFGCFVIFGASTIASGLVSAVESGGVGAELAQLPQPVLTSPAPPSAPPAAPAQPYDPYAGAALPSR